MGGLLRIHRPIAQCRIVIVLDQLYRVSDRQALIPRYCTFLLSRLTCTHSHHSHDLSMQEKTRRELQRTPPESSPSTHWNAARTEQTPAWFRGVSGSCLSEVLSISGEVFFVSVGFRRGVSFRECVHRFEISRYQRRLFQVFIPSFIPYTFIVSNRAGARSETHSRYVLDRVRGC